MMGDLRAVTDRVLAWADTRVASTARKGNRGLLIAAVVIFIAVTAVSVANLPPLEGPIGWGFLVLLALVGIPLTIGLNATEFAISGRIAGKVIGPHDALRVALIGAAANNLPLPGAAAVRLGWLRSAGSTYSHAVSATVVMGLAWLGVTTFAAGCFLLTQGTNLLALGFIGGGLLTLLVGGTLLARRVLTVNRRVQIGGAILLVEACFVFVLAFRYWLTLQAIGYEASPTQVVALSMSVVLASALGVFPGGLGLRELIAAAISPVVGLPVAIGVLAVALDRLVALAFMAIATSVLAAGSSKSRRRPQTTVATPQAQDPELLEDR